MSTSINIPCPACGRELKIRDRSLLGRRGKCPKCGHAFVLDEPPEVELELASKSAPAVGTSARWVPDQPAGPAVGAPAPAAAPYPVAAPPVVISAGSEADRLRALKRRQSQNRLINIGIGVAVVLVGGGIGLFLMNSPPPPRPSEKSAAAEPGDDAGPAEKPAGAATATTLARPTKGEPISLQMVPAGARLLVHLRPAELWQPDSPGEEFRFCLGPLGEFVDQQLKTICKRPPSEVEEVLMAWIPGPRGTPPDFAAVVRLKDDAKKSELLEMLGGERVDTYGRPVYISGETAGLIVDLKTYALGPAKMAEEMVAAVGGQNPMPDGVEGLIKLTDRQRHITVLFEPTSILLDQEFLAAPNVRPLLTQFMDWFGDGVETVAWSLHLERDRFYSEIHVRNQTGVRTTALEERLQEGLSKLPKELLSAVQLMHPQEAGKRKIIGRVPAMAKVFQMATQSDHGARQVHLVTALPDRAAPNLALGTLLAWDESTRTDFNRKPPTTPQPGSSDAGKLPTTIAERLKQKIDVDFRRTPLQEAFAYVGDETKVTIEIDGDALKLSGYTKNMPQEFKLEKTPATAVLQKILEKYDKMCLVVDENKKIALITTYPVAEQQGLKPFPLKP